MLCILWPKLILDKILKTVILLIPLIQTIIMNSEQRQIKIKAKLKGFKG